MGKTITVTIEFPEGYEDVHEDLCIADLQLHKDFKIIDKQELRDLDFINRELKDAVVFYKAENARMREALTLVKHHESFYLSEKSRGIIENALKGGE